MEPFFEAVRVELGAVAAVEDPEGPRAEGPQTDGALFLLVVPFLFHLVLQGELLVARCTPPCRERQGQLIGCEPLLKRAVPLIH